MPDSITVALVHGAYADSSSWSGVIERLQAKGVQVTAIVNPLRGITIDSEYVASALQQIPGPVLVVGHSYGGAVMSNAATPIGDAPYQASRTSRHKAGPCAEQRSWGVTHATQTVPLQGRPDGCAAVGTRRTVKGDAQASEMCGLIDR